MSDNNNSLTNPLAAILAAAAKTTSSKSSQEKVYQRTNQSPGHSSFDIQLLDTSGSMASSIEDGTRKIDILANIFAQLPYCPSNYSFASDVRSINYSTKLTAAGGTNLALALQTITSLNPKKILIISDGVPDSTDAAFTAAAKLNCEISCFYIGLDRDIEAKEFLQKLARKYDGKYEDCDISQFIERQQLPQRIQKLLPEN